MLASAESTLVACMDSGRCPLLLTSFNQSAYNPVILHERITEATGGTSKAGDDVFLDDSVMPRKGEPGTVVELSWPPFGSSCCGASGRAWLGAVSSTGPCWGWGVRGENCSSGVGSGRRIGPGWSGGAMNWASCQSITALAGLWRSPRELLNYCRSTVNSLGDECHN